MVPEVPVIEMAAEMADASTLRKLATVVVSDVVTSASVRLTLEAAFMTSVLVPVPPSMEVSVPL